jgi:hypothetical protein
LEHPFPVDYQRGCFGDGRRLRLDELAKLCGKEENRVGEDGRWNIVVPFALVTNMDETMIYAHLEFVGRLVAIALVLVKFLETLKGCTEIRNRRFQKMKTSLTVHQLLLLHRNREPCTIAFKM